MATKTDNTRQPLSQSQETALACLMAGDTTEQAAAEAGVTRQTLSEWLNHNADFIAELNRRRSELWQMHVERLRNLGGKALDVLSEDLDCKGDRRLRQAAALAILKQLGLQALRPIGPTAAEDVEFENRQRESAKSLDELLMQY